MNNAPIFRDKLIKLLLLHSVPDVSYPDECTLPLIESYHSDREEELSLELKCDFLNLSLNSNDSIPVDVSLEKETFVTRPIQINNDESNRDVLSVTLRSDDSLPIYHEPSGIVTPTIPINCVSDIVNNQAQRLVNHILNFNNSLSNLEVTAQIVNSTPNASIRIPTTKYKLKQTITTFSMEYHIRCANCQNYSVTTKMGRHIECDSCSAVISTSSSEFFVYIPLEQQLREVFHENFAEICSYPYRQDDDSIRDVHDCIQHEKASKKYSESKLVSLVACTDGVKLYNSSKKSLWAIQLYVNCLEPVWRYVPESILVVAFHVSEHKPNMQEFFYPLMMELKKINEGPGIVINKNGKSLNLMPVITQFCGDVPAKAEVQEMTSHAGYYACGYCLHPGVAVKKNEKSKSYVRYINRKTNEVMRTHENVIKTYERLNDSSSPIHGIKGISCLLSADDFDLINGFGIDYMHCILLGILNKLFDLWLNSTHHRELYYITPKCQDALNKRIIKIKPTSDISRKPRSIFERADYKANELRSFLLYYLRFCLPDLLKKCYIDHFQLLSSACYILLKENISKDEVNLAEERLIKFSNEFERLYGASNVTFNVHLVKHMGSSVRHLGPLWAQSAFGMEGNNGIINKTTSKKFPVHSIAWKYCARRKKKNERVDDEMKYSVAEKTTTTFTSNELEAIQDKLSIQIQHTIYKSVNISGKKYTSKKSKEIKSIDYFVELSDGKFGIVNFYFVHDFVIYGLLDLYELVEQLDHLSVVKSADNNEVFEISELKRKLIYMRIGNKEIITSIPNRFEKT